MQRRSARLPQHPPKSLAEDDFVPEEDIVDDEHEEVVVVKPKRKKRKTDAGASEGHFLPKKPRGKRGLLQKVVEMPLDLLFEIFGRLTPADLLNLARTTKDMRAMLMSRSSAFIWKAARANVPGLPECPDDLSEPRYADLMFGKNCHLCSRSVSNVHYCWASRVRVCTRCVEEESRFMKRLSHLRSSSFVKPPCVTINKSGRRYRSVTYYDAVVDLRWTEEYTAATDKGKWLETYKAEREARDLHAAACDVWFENMQDLRQQEKESMFDDRMNIILDYTKQLGWAEELLKMAEHCIELEDQPEIIRVCKKNITNQVLSKLTDFINGFMEKQKADRLEIEHRVLLIERLPALKKILESYVSTLPANALHPNTGELFRNPAIRDMVYNKEEYESLDSVVKLLPNVTGQWLKEIREQLLDMIKVARPDYTFDSDTVLDLATTVFRCTECNITLRYPVALMHSCAFRKGYGYFPTSTSLEESTLHNTIQETYWNKLDHIVYKENYAKAMSETLEMAGFDPTTTTGTEMDNLNPVFECVGCNSHSEGRLTMQWIAAAEHRLKPHYGDNVLDMELLKEEEAAIVRPRILEEVDKERARTWSAQFICLHCKKVYGPQDLRKHMTDEHGQAKLLRQDIVSYIGCKIQPSTFRLWPPRDG